MTSPPASDNQAQDPDETDDMDDEKAASRLYIVRHGSAEEHHVLGDGARALTSEGREEFRELAHDVGPRLRLKAIATSPLVRATQTAEILADASDIAQVVVHGELHAERATGQSVAQLARELGPGWALVGHNPSLAGALALLLGLDEEPRFRKGAIAALRPAGKGEKTWTLDWVISPGKKQRREF